MFLATQLLGLVIIDAYSPKTVPGENGTLIKKNVTIPYNLEPPQQAPEISLASIIFSFIIAIGIFLLLSKFKANNLIQIWFSFVVLITMAVSLNALILKFFPNVGLEIDNIALLIAVPLTFFKVFKRNLIVHNATELLVYPGLASMFVPILRPWSIVALLILISFYDMWAVWRSQFMVKLAKYQIKNLKIFTGFFIPYLPKKESERIQKFKAMKGKSKSMKLSKGKIKVSLALLGGGDVAFPLIFSGVIMRFGGGLIPALFATMGATLGLLFLFAYSKKGKFYPAMPFITAGILIAWLISYLF